VNLDRGRRPPSPGNPYRHPAGRTYRLMYACALLTCTAIAWRRRQEMGEVWGAAVRWAREQR
jgi:hypothetical protein